MRARTCLPLNIRAPEDGADFRSSHELIVGEGDRGVKGDRLPAQWAAAVRGRGLAKEKRQAMRGTIGRMICARRAAT